MRARAQYGNFAERGREILIGNCSRDSIWKPGFFFRVELLVFERAEMLEIFEILHDNSFTVFFSIAHCGIFD